MLRRLPAVPILASFLVVTASSAGFGFTADRPSVNAPAAKPPCASSASKAPCHRAEHGPAPAAPSDRCDPFRTACAITCRLVGTVDASGSILGLAAMHRAWQRLELHPSVRPSAVPEPVPRSIAV